MNRGSGPSQGHGSGYRFASMRPRFMNRGSVGLGMLYPAPIFASMRPRFMNRGSRGGLVELVIDRESFNEAPIHESGKL